MNLLRKYIRKEILAEERGKNAAPPKGNLTGKDFSGKTKSMVQKLINSNIGIRIDTFSRKGRTSTDIVYVDASSGDDLEFEVEEGRENFGAIVDIEPVPGKYGPCGGNAYKIGMAAAPQGWGPLLYDIAIEYIESIGGAGLISDRRSVSDFAVPIWDVYYEARPDIIAIQLNNKAGKPNPKAKNSNCDQKVAIEDMKRRPEIKSWIDSPLSKLYKTGPNHYNAYEALKKKGLIFYESE